MAVIRESNKTDFKPRPQNRKKGTGEGRTCFLWVKRLPWLLIAAEQLLVVDSGGGDALLEKRKWKVNWNISPAMLKQELENMFPGLSEYMRRQKTWVTPWEELLLNRVYKMYYNGTSARGHNHNPNTRAAISSEHWRNKKYRLKWEKPILRIVSRRLVAKHWKGWV
jgi:hypothetical protein